MNDMERSDTCGKDSEGGKGACQKGSTSEKVSLEGITRLAEKTKSSRKLNIFALFSFLLGLVAVFLGALPFGGVKMMVLELVFCSLGILFAFAGSIQSARRGISGKGLSLAGLIMSLVMFFGAVSFFVFDQQGRPAAFGIDPQTDQKMWIMVGVSVSLLLVCAGVALLYALVSKKQRRGRE